MKFTTAAIFAALATAVSASFTILEPWSATTWESGKSGTVSWTSTPDEAGKKCEIHLLTGPSDNAIFVANLTANGNLVPCEFIAATFYPLPDYATGNYFVRLGENGASYEYYAYSANFHFIGNGTVTSGL
ncbi:uncharacterized protein BX663DRAFT_549728 [Cokeromyces recurvatus]|uniref:uncharacterized protein n=1 Tax=Cokeromyces recurvatus TaxID=90255 RepID=UPI00221E9DA1|nr:uncharacterized protein BX663DRAFT_549728 [Cokeromyces recurvatus]KAI7905767.1 hypothetical protein BX663DRAFT_549728 [Cokeromyces recurvatus]